MPVGLSMLSLKDALYGTQRLHLENLRDRSKMKSKSQKGRFVTPISMPEADICARKSLDMACDLMSWVSIDKVGAEGRPGQSKFGVT